MYDKKIIHRDLKPANILMMNDVIIKITDFGFARELIDMKDPGYFTRAGTPMYMSP